MKGVHGSGAVNFTPLLLPPTPSQLNNLAVAAGVGGVGEPAVKAHGGKCTCCMCVCCVCSVCMLCVFVPVCKSLR